MTKKKKITIGVLSSVVFLLIAILFGLIFTGMYVGWGPFTRLFWNQEVRRVKKSYPYENNQNGIVFYGASNFRMWYEITDDLHEYKVANCGFGGSTDKLMVEYADRLLYPYNPQIVFFQTGSNDYVEMKGNDDEKISACMEYKKQMFSTFHERMPNAKFVVMSGLLLPGRSAYTELTIKVNTALELYCKSQNYMTFVDSTQMTYDGEQYMTDLFIKDGIHLNHTGQLKWRDEYIKPVIEMLIETNPELESVKK